MRTRSAGERLYESPVWVHHKGAQQKALSLLLEQLNNQQHKMAINCSEEIEATLM